MIKEAHGAFALTTSTMTMETMTVMKAVKWLENKRVHMLAFSMIQ